MECTNCHGVGLVPNTQDGVLVSQSVCPTCKGVGHDGTRVEEPATLIEKVLKKVTSKKK